MAWNLPDGVTGRERVFGPEAEFEEERTCERPNATVWVVDENMAKLVNEWLRARAAKFAHRTVEAARLASTLEMQMVQMMAVSGVLDVELDECPFVGPVTVQVYDGIASWTCPVCGQDYEEDLEAEYEAELADKYRDERMNDD